MTVFFSDWKLLSMTGMGQASASNSTITVFATLKSVNHRSLDIKYRLANELHFLESDIGALIAKNCERGRIEIEVSCECSLTKSSKYVMDEERIQALLVQLKQLHSRMPELSLTMSVGDLLAVPGIMVQDHNWSPDDLKALTLTAVSDALTDLLKSRRHEGAILQQSFKTLLAFSQKIMEEIVDLSHNDAGKRFERLKNRLDDLFGHLSINEDRLYQEFALLAERFDFKEEIDRLLAHTVHFNAVCQEPAAKGRKLDFLCQEMLRETNTLMSKAFDQAITKKAIDLKAQVERIREQVQNIE